MNGPNDTATPGAQGNPTLTPLPIRSSSPSVQNITRETFMPHVSPPEKFNFQVPANWPQWRKRFERYIGVSGLKHKSQQEKIDILLYVMGEESEQVVVQFPTVPVTFEGMLQAFDKYFIPRRNVIFERFKFNSRTQLPGESADSFITALHTLAEHCEYGTLKEDLIRDRIVVGMTDTKTSERLQLQGNLTLADAVFSTKQAEIQNKQSHLIHHEVSRDPQLNMIKSKPGNKAKQYFKTNVQSKQSTTADNCCKYCGLKPFHSRENCPAKNAICRGCQKRGHWDKVCKSKKFPAKKSVQSIDTDKVDSSDVGQDVQFIGSIEHSLRSIFKNDKNQWLINLKVNDSKHLISFLIDTGADIVCLPESSLNVQSISRIKNSQDIISGPDGKTLSVLGKLNLVLTCPSNNKSCNIDVYIIKDLKMPILGRPGISCLEIIDISKSLNCIMSKSQSSVNISQEFPSLLKEMGEFKGEIQIRLKGSVEPYVQSSPRVVPLPLLDKLEAELKRLLNLNIIVPVEHPTSWVAPIVVVPKGDTVRMCCDYTQLNKNVLRSHFPIPKVETTLTKLKGACIFSKLDIRSSFYQLKLSKESQPLTTFITPFGRFMFKRLPFGITCAPEYFSQKFSNLFRDLKGVTTHIDDILVYANSIEKHDETLRAVLTRLSNEGITLNQNKCVIGVNTINFLGHLISKSGIKIDPERIEAITKFPEPTNKKELQRLLGMINFTARFIPNKSEILNPLTTLLKNDIMFVWDEAQKQSFSKIKELLIDAPCLSYFDPQKQIIVSADASSYGIGCALMQVNGMTKERELVAYASRTLSPTESRYAQIEKETLSLTWACEKFQEYLIGISFILETDHRPLVQVLQTKHLDELTPRLQRFRMRLMRYVYTVVYTPGSKLQIADALSRSPLQIKPVSEELSSEIEAYVQLIVKNLPVKDVFLKKIISEQQIDPICKKLKEFVLSGWPERGQLSPELVVYYQYRSDITFNENLLLKGTRIFIPPPLRHQVLQFIHAGHQGIVKCRERAKMSVWWIGLSAQIEQLVRSCPNCVEERSNIKETFIKDCIPSRPWSKVAIDLFKYKVWYLIITDYYSRFFEIVELNSLNEQTVINELKKIFARFGIPDIVRSDNGPQFQSSFKIFAKDYNFVHITSSPYFSQSNGCVEAAVKVAKSLLKKNSDFNLALMAYRSTPLDCGFSPYELLFSRKMRTMLPILPSQLDKIVNTQSVFQETEERRKEKQRCNYNSRHNSKDLKDLPVGSSVWVTDLRKYGKIKEKCDEPRSYIIQTSNGDYRRNRWCLIEAPYYEFKPTPTIEPTTTDDETYNFDNASGIEQDLHESVSSEQGNNSDVPENQISEDASNVTINKTESPGSSTGITINVPTKSKRHLRKPGWLQDYVTY